MKIIKHGQKKHNEWQFTCSECGCMFQTREGEAQTHECGAEDTGLMFARCPECDEPCYARWVDKIEVPDPISKGGGYFSDEKE